MSYMSVLYINKNKYKILASKKRAIEHTDKFENFLSIIIVVLATIEILRTLLQAILQFL